MEQQSRKEEKSKHGAPRTSAGGESVSKMPFPGGHKSPLPPITCASFSSCASIAAAPATSREVPRGRSSQLALKGPPTRRWSRPPEPGISGSCSFYEDSGLRVLGQSWSKAPAPRASSRLPLRGYLCSRWYHFLDEQDSRLEPGWFFSFLYFYF